VGIDSVPAVTDDHDQMLGVQPGGSPQCVFDQGPTGQRVQYFGDRRVHPGAFSGGQHDRSREAPVWEHSVVSFPHPGANRHAADRPDLT
jgi:hypothetical protein